MSEQFTLSADSQRVEDFLDQQSSREGRTGFTGWVLPLDKSQEIFRYLQQKFNYDFLSSVTGVDNYPDPTMEVVYHLCRSTGGSPLVLRVIVDRNDPHVPSLASLYKGAEFQEREIWDLFGIKFDGHPDLRRILLWEGFERHPLRKDWKEPFYEEEVKPFKSRWPEGQAKLIESENPLFDNVQFPPDFVPDQWKAEDETVLMNAVMSKPVSEELGTDELVINLGPQHPSTHGVFRMLAATEGEKIVNLKPVMGYLHRNHEKIGERNTFLQIMPYTDRLDYITSMSNNFGYAITVEKLMGVTPPERAEYIRVMMAELTRISSHIMSNGFLLNDLGAYFTPSLYSLEERELILDVFEAASGSRMMCNYFRFGGVARDVPPEALKKVRDLVENRLPRKIDELDRYLTNNELVQMRSQGVGVITDEQAINSSITGPILRASGVPYDVRRADPYSIYDRLQFDVVTKTHGDVYDRYLVRLEEMRQSLRILKQVLDQMPEGPIMTGRPAYQVRVPAGESYGRIEGPKGELGYYVISDGKPNPKRYHVRAPSFINLTGLEQMCIGEKIADVVAIVGSVDIILGEVDR